MHFTSIALICGFLTIANAWNITETFNHVCGPCQSECNSWVTSVGDCITATNQTYNASINVADLNSFQFSGDLNPLGECACTAVAVQSSQSCLACFSEKTNLKPAVSMQDYFMVCQNPMNAISIFARYHQSWVNNITVGGETCSTDSEGNTAQNGSSSSTNLNSSNGAGSSTDSATGGSGDVGGNGSSTTSPHSSSSSTNSNSSTGSASSSSTMCPVTRRSRR